MAEPESLEEIIRIRRASATPSLDQSLDRDTATQLRKRLMIVAVVIAATTLVWFGLAQVGVLADVGLGSLTGVYFAVMLGISVPPFVLMVRQPQLSLRRLRQLEAVIFGGAGVILVLGEWTWFRGGWALEIPRPGQELRFMELLADEHSFSWFVMMILYATLIPASGRRCAAVVGTYAALALLVVLLFAWVDPEHTSYYLETVLGKTIFWMALAVAIAVHGARRLTQLRRQAFEAARLGQYELKKRLGAGGMGEVFLAEHQLLRRPCAVKLIRPDKAADPGTLLRFQREVKAMASLTHSNVVDIFDYGQAEDGVFYYVMEYLTGLNLQELVERHGPLPPERAVHLLQQVCWPLREAHLNGLVHRDIKPSNIFVGESGRIYDVVKLLDFGLVHHLGHPPAVREGANDEDARKTWSSQLTAAGRIVGTPLYMSPEQISGAATLDPRTDIYSLGVVAYYLLSGIVPFQRKSFQEVVSAHLREPVVPLFNVCPAVDVDLNGVVMRCLEKDPAQRFQDAESLAQALAHCSCASRWTMAMAEAWWRANPLPA